MSLVTWLFQMKWVNWGGGHCDWPIPKRGCLIGGDLWHTLINWGGRIQRIQKTMASDKKGLSNWGGIFNPVSTLSKSQVLGMVLLLLLLLCVYGLALGFLFLFIWFLHHKLESFEVLLLFWGASFGAMEVAYELLSGTQLSPTDLLLWWGIDQHPNIVLLNIVSWVIYDIWLQENDHQTTA